MYKRVASFQDIPAHPQILHMNKFLSNKKQEVLVYFMK